jgi:hypothetical protein
LQIILLNSGQQDGKMDGEFNTHRRWAKSILTNLLCLELPLLKKEQAEHYVIKNSSIPFQRKSECMQCHVTMDNLASVIRNVELYNTAVDGFQMISLKGAYVHPINPKSNLFYNQSTHGEIILNLDNRLVKYELNNVNELGKWIAKNKNFYSCSLKKVFTFLTGQNTTQVNSVSTTNEAKEKWSFIDNLTDSFMKNQNYREAMLEIINSKYF